MLKMRGAARLAGFDKPTIWTMMSQLAIKTKSVNLGQGFPSWHPPQFYSDYLVKILQESDQNHQYTRAFGSLNYTKSIHNFHKNRGAFENIDHETQITTVFGGVEGLFCSIMGNVNPGDEVLFFDPSYDCYRPQIQMAGGKAIGLPLRPKKSVFFG